MKVVVDTREQTPYDFENMIVKTLKTGDYSVVDYEDEVAVERKGVSDAIGSVLQGRVRFEKEWERAKHFKRFFIVIEGTQNMIRKEIIKLSLMNNGNPNRIKRNVKSVLHTYIHWSAKYGVPVFFCEGREEAKWLTFELLRASVKYLDNGKIPIDEASLVEKFNLGI